LDSPAAAGAAPAAATAAPPAAEGAATAPPAGTEANLERPEEKNNKSQHIEGLHTSYSKKQHLRAISMK
jgi:hypothetical protein